MLPRVASTMNRQQGACAVRSSQLQAPLHCAPLHGGPFHSLHRHLCRYCSATCGLCSGGGASVQGVEGAATIDSVGGVQTEEGPAPCVDTPPPGLFSCRWAVAHTGCKQAVAHAGWSTAPSMRAC